jgi:hypothetical protein
MSTLVGDGPIFIILKRKMQMEKTFFFILAKNGNIISILFMNIFFFVVIAVNLSKII